MRDIMNHTCASFLSLVIVQIFIHLNHVHSCGDCASPNSVRMAIYHTKFGSLSDTSHFSEMAAENKELLVLPEIPADPQDYPKWLRQTSAKTLQSFMKIKNDNQIVERTSYHGLFLWARYWNPDVGLWEADEADLEELTAANIAEQCENLPQSALNFLENEDRKHYMLNEDSHRDLQIAFRGAILTAVANNQRLNRPLQVFDKNIEPLDLYQGVRVFIQLLELMRSVLQREVAQMLQSGLRIGQEVSSNPDISRSSVHEAIDSLENYCEALQLAGYRDAELQLVGQFRRQVRNHRVPIISTAVQRAREDTIESLRDSFLRLVPPDDQTEIEAEASLAQASRPQQMNRTVSTLFSQLKDLASTHVSNAMMSMLSEKNTPTSGGKTVSSSQKKTFTYDEQASYIQERKESKKTIQKLSKQLQQQRLEPVVRGRGRGFGRGRGRGAGRGDSGRSQEAEIEADFAQAENSREEFEAFNLEQAENSRKIREEFEAFMLEADNFLDTVPDSSLLGDFSSSHAEEFPTKSSAVPDSTSEHEPVKDQPSDNTVVSNSDSPASVPAVPTLPTAEHEAAKDTTTTEHDTAKDTQSEGEGISNSKGLEQGKPVLGSSWITRLMILFMIFIAASVVVFPEIFTFLASLDFMGTMVWTSSVTGAALVSGRRLGQGVINTTSIGAFFVFIVIVCFFNGPPCRAAALQIYIQISGKEDTLLDQRVNFPLSGFSTPLMNEFQDQRTTSMRDFLLQKPVVLMMVTQGDTSNFEYKWCNDGGANKSVSGNRADFTGNFRSVDIFVIVAQKREL